MSKSLEKTIDFFRSSIEKLKTKNVQKEIEEQLNELFTIMPENIPIIKNNYYTALCENLFNGGIKAYKKNENNVCIWRFMKKISDDQLENINNKNFKGSYLELLDILMRIYFYSEPLDDLTCLFIPIPDKTKIHPYLNWIRNYFYNENYPTSVLWLYALDSSILKLFPDELFFIGRSKHDEIKDILIPDFSYKESTLIKRYSDDLNDYSVVTGSTAIKEFNQIFSFLNNEFLDRCLSHSGNQSDYLSKEEYNKEWQKFHEVLSFGVSDKEEKGSISFSDLRSSTKFLQTIGKNSFRNKIQQPFFEGTKLISEFYNGRIDKFMGDNVMCAFLSTGILPDDKYNKDQLLVKNNIMAIISLCRNLYTLLENENMQQSSLGLRSGIAFGDQILRSNLGNDIVRDFTVTGETVNLAARLEHISIEELIIQNSTYFENTIKRFNELSKILEISNENNLNEEGNNAILRYTKYQNIITNLHNINNERFDIRLNNNFYQLFKEVLLIEGFTTTDDQDNVLNGYEMFTKDNTELKIYYSYYKPKGFNDFEKIWIMPLPVKILKNYNILDAQT